MGLLKLSYRERRICDTEERKAYFSSRIKYSSIGYVYFIYKRKKIVYIGCTTNPHSREPGHYSRLLKMGIKSYVVEFVGPFPYWMALKIESSEIAKITNSPHLLNRHCRNKNYDTQKKYAIENYKRKSVLFKRNKYGLKKIETI